MNADLLQKREKIIAYEGLISAPFTAFDPNNSALLNNSVFPAYVEHLVNNGVRGVFVNGTTGEGLSLTVNERKQIAENWVRYGQNKLDLIIIHIGANSIEDAKELARHAESLRVTGIAALPPLFYKPTNNDQLVQYFKEIATAAPITPLMLYHIPSYSGVEISISSFLPTACREVPTFCGAKFTSVDVRDLLRVHSLSSSSEIKIFSGFDEVLLPCLASGVTAAVGATYNFAYTARLSLKILEYFKRGDPQARRFQNLILRATDAITRHGQGISCFKETMNILGPLNFGPTRAPLLPLDEAAKAHLRRDVEMVMAELRALLVELS